MTGHNDDIVIVGGGHAAAIAAVSLRKLEVARPIRILCAESELPYQRPPLSKGYLSGSYLRERLAIRHAEFYSERGIELHLGQTVRAIDRQAKQVRFEDGDTVAYGDLILATGAREIRLDIPGADLAGIHTVREIADIDHLRGELEGADVCAVIGGGFIGLETAAVFRKLDKKVILFEAAERLMGRSVSQEISEFYLNYHRAQGVDIRLSALVAGIDGADGRIAAVESGDGERVAADLVVMGVGVRPRDELARAAGLKCERGVLVDEFCRTDDKHIYAIGDCTRHRNLRYDDLLCLESVQNAVDQANVVATVLAGAPQPYDMVPWFWTDQYDLKLQIAGLTRGADDRLVYDDSSESGKLGICHFRAGELIAVETVNRAADHVLARRLLSASTPTRRADLLEPAASLKALAGLEKPQEPS